MTTTEPVAIDPTANRTRFGGLFLAAASLITIVSLLIYILGVPTPVADEATFDRAQKLANNATALRTASYLGVAADLLLAFGAFFLVTRTMQLRTMVPVPAFWICVAVGAIVFVGVDAFMASAMVTIAQNAASDPAMFEAAEAGTNALFGLGVLCVSFGSAVVLWGETRAANAVLPAWACYVGMAGAILGFISAFGPLTGVMQFGFLFLGAFLSVLALVWLGFRLGFPNLMGGSGKETSHAPKRAHKD